MELVVNLCIVPVAVKVKRSACQVRIVDTVPEVSAVFEAGPALFGPTLGSDIAGVTAELHMLSGSSGLRMGTGCDVFSEEDSMRSANKVVMLVRGGCLFVQKVRNRERDMHDVAFFFSFFEIYMYILKMQSIFLFQ